MDTIMLDNPYPYGPFGAKGVGEDPMDGPAPAIANALFHIGLDVRKVPALPEELMHLAAQRPAVSGQRSA